MKVLMIITIAIMLMTSAFSITEACNDAMDCPGAEACYKDDANKPGVCKIRKMVVVGWDCWACLATGSDSVWSIFPGIELTDTLVPDGHEQWDRSIRTAYLIKCRIYCIHRFEFFFGVASMLFLLHVITSQSIYQSRRVASRKPTSRWKRGRDWLLKRPMSHQQSLCIKLYCTLHAN